MWLISWWLLPTISACMWVAMLITMLTVWALEGSPHYPSMGANQHIAYISDIGAFGLKPLFQTGSVITVVFLDLGFLAERYLRSKGKLAPNTSVTQVVLDWISLFFAIAGAAGLILLSNFDTYHYPRIHDGCLLLFIAGYVISAIFLCAEYQRLGIHYRNHRILALSFWIKLAFIVIEVILAIVFASCSYTKHQNIAAVFEWIIAFVYTFWVLSFVIDLLPSVRTKKHVPQGAIDLAVKRRVEATGGSFSGYESDVYREHEMRNGHHGYANGRGNQAGMDVEQNLTSDSAGPNQNGGSGRRFF